MYERIVKIERRVPVTQRKPSAMGTAVVTTYKMEESWIVLDKSYRCIESEHPSFEEAKKQVDTMIQLDRACPTCED